MLSQVMTLLGWSEDALKRDLSDAAPAYSTYAWRLRKGAPKLRMPVLIPFEAWYLTEWEADRVHPSLEVARGCAASLVSIAKNDQIAHCVHKAVGKLAMCKQDVTQRAALMITEVQGGKMVRVRSHLLFILILHRGLDDMSSLRVLFCDARTKVMTHVFPVLQFTDKRTYARKDASCSATIAHARTHARTHAHAHTGACARVLFHDAKICTHTHTRARGNRLPRESLHSCLPSTLPTPTSLRARLAMTF